MWHSGAALLSILGVIYPRDSVAEMAAAIALHDAGWSHRFRSDLDRIDQYAHCGCEVVVTDPIEDVPAMCRDLDRPGRPVGTDPPTQRVRPGRRP